MGKFIGEWNSSLIVFSGFQTRIGYVDVKSSPVYFYFQRYCIVFNTITDTPNSFETERLNGGHERNVGKVHGAKGLNLFIFIYRICTVSSFIFIRRFFRCIYVSFERQCDRMGKYWWYWHRFTIRKVFLQIDTVEPETRVGALWEILMILVKCLRIICFRLWPQV